MVNLGTQSGKVIIKVARRANTPPKSKFPLENVRLHNLLEFFTGPIVC